MLRHTTTGEYIREKPEFPCEETPIMNNHSKSNGADPIRFLAHRYKSVESGILHISNLRFVSLFKWEYGKYWHETSCLLPDEEIVSVSAL